MAADSSQVLFVLGTRPEIIKLAPVIRATERSSDLSAHVVHTGQHYDPELSEVFFDSLDLSPPDIHLDVGSGTQAAQTADALRGLERLILERSPDGVTALGDTNAVLSAALATSKTDPQFVHIEAGIRSFDRSMPEEVNRVLADQVTDLAFAPTEGAVDNLGDEGITSNVYNVGNTVVDACFEHRPIAEETSSVLERFDLDTGDYVIATIHRPRNTDDPERLRTVAGALDGQEFPVILPTHPRTRDALEALEFEASGSLHLVDPLDYLDFLTLLANARVAVTDSGGVQEEASILEIPCLTVRPNTERPETVDAGVNELLEPSELSRRLAALYADPADRETMTGHPDLYGDGRAAEKIVAVLESELA